MADESLVAPSWTRGEKHKHRALIALAILAGGLVAAAPRNERRLFLLPNLPIAFTAIAGPEPTALRSPVMGYLDDGCSPDLDGASRGFDRAVDSADCGRGRKRPTRTPAPEEEPSAFFAMPEEPILFDAPLLVFSELSPEPEQIGPVTGNRRGARPNRPVGAVTTALLGGIPEPATWAMMVSGFALAGFALRRRPEAPSRA